MTKRETVDLLRSAVDDSIAELEDHPEKEWAKIRISELNEAMQNAEKALCGETAKA